MTTAYAAQPASPQSQPPSPPQIVGIDNLLREEDRQAVCDFLMGPGWAFGARSAPTPGASRYWYKHFAGYARDGEDRNPAEIEAELQAAPVIQRMWQALKANQLRGHRLMRCYANGYPSGAEGSPHRDSLEPNHFTAIYYPHKSWDPGYAGETVFFNADGSDIVASVYPKPNRLVVFRGDILHVARGVSRSCPDLRVTLMFKTAVLAG